MLSICIFGSQARRTADAMSDRDVLLVGPSSPILDRAVTEWRLRDWNVSVFDQLAFRRLADVKALFIQHLKQEGRVLHDDGDFLTSVMEGYSPKADYSAERNDAFAQIVALPANTGEYWHDLCLADVVYVLFRNAAILHLASAEEYCFQFNTTVERMACLFELSQEDRLALLLLRDLKHGYRRRAESLTACSPLQEARRVIDRVIARLPDATTSSIAGGVTTDDYFRLRLTELEIVKKLDPRVLDGLTAKSNFFELWQCIVRGGGYPKPKPKSRPH